MSRISAAPRCRRCGQCCLAGGPTLMREDAPLLRSGILPVKTLVCLRRGEWARDDAREVVRPLARELIKVAGRGDARFPWRCVFYDPGSGCGVYARRPAQCVALFCMDTAPLEDLLAQGKNLDRRAALESFPDLNAAARSLWLELAAAHDEQCPADAWLAAAQSLGFCPRPPTGATGAKQEFSPVADEAARRAVSAALAEAARCDAAFRELCVQRAGVPAAALPFLLGRPLAVLLAEVGLRAAQK